MRKKKEDFIIFTNLKKNLEDNKQFKNKGDIFLIKIKNKT